jgi:WD40 repeat protein
MFTASVSSRQRLLRPCDASSGATDPSGPDWVCKLPQRGGTRGLYAVAVSSDGRYLAAGGGDKQVHVWDVRTQKYIQVRHSQGTIA